MSLGSLLASLVAVVLSVAAVFSYQWVALVPRLGVETLYHLRPIRIGIAVVSIGLALGAFLLSPTPLQAGLLVLVVALTPLSGFLNARRLFVPLEDPRRLPASEAVIEDGASVVGIEVNGDAHAWPVETLIPHHIVNDEIAGRPVLAAWCAYCNSGIVYDAAVDGERLTFAPVTIRQRNMVMRDRETGTLWQHATGEALAGPLEGTELSALGGRLMTWEAWTHEHPETTVVVEPPPDEWSGLLPRPLTRRLADRKKYVELPGIVATDRRLPFTEEVIGVEIGGEAKAYPIAAIRQEGTIYDSVGGEELTVAYDETSDQADVTRDGEPMGFQRTRWMGWFEFHPETAVYGESGASR